MRVMDEPDRLETLLAASGMHAIPWVDRYPWQLVQIPKGEHLCRLGEPVGHLVLFLEGRLSVSVPTPQGRSYLISYCRVGTLVCGDVEVAEGGSSAATDIRAETLSWCAVIPLDPYRQALLSDLDFLRYALRRLSGELVRGSIYAANNLLAPLENRLAKYLIITAHQGVFQENLTRLAELMGVSYRQLSRVMRSFRERGYIRKEGAAWRLVDTAALESLGTYV